MDSGKAFPFPALHGGHQSNRKGPKVVPGVPTAAWKQDDKMVRCGICVKRFGLLRWKHHCRACGDICCRRCLGFCLVDVPDQGVDLVYTCARCIQKHTDKQVLVGDVNWPYLMGSQNTRTYPSGSIDSFVTAPASDCGASVVPASPCSFASSLTPSGSPLKRNHDYNVIVSQYRNRKLHSVCSLVDDYLDCTGGAIVLLKGSYLWVIAHKGLRSRVLHDPAFVSICRRAVRSQSAFSDPQPMSSSAADGSADHNAFRFFGAAPIFDVRVSSGPALGCLVALDTHARSGTNAAKVESTLENLADHVMELLAREETILRIYASGDFKIFAANATDVASAGASFDTFSGASPVASGTMSFASTATTRPRRSSSFAFGEEVSAFFPPSYGDKIVGTTATSSKTEGKKLHVPFSGSSPRPNGTLGSNAA